MTSTQIAIALDTFLNAKSYHPCCLLVHRDVRQLQRIGAEITATRQWPSVSIGNVVATALLPLSTSERPHGVQQAFASAIDAYIPGPIVCTDIDLLFEPSLRLDPLRLLRDASRRATLIVLWPGTTNRMYLSYATSDPPHAHHRSWPRSELCEACVIPLEPLT
jgi:hypothetical protein